MDYHESKRSLWTGLALLMLLIPFNVVEYRLHRRAALAELSDLAATTAAVTEQSLQSAMLNRNLPAIQDALECGPEQVRDYLGRAGARVGESIDQSHRLISDLRPPVLDDYGLGLALREELERRLQPLGILTVFRAEGNLDQVPPEVATAAFRISQEAVTNIIRQATRSNRYAYHGAAVPEIPFPMMFSARHLAYTRVVGKICVLLPAPRCSWRAVEVASAGDPT